MATIKTLASRLDKLERRCNQHGEFQVIEQYSPESEFWAACQFAMIRSNSKIVFRFPHRLTIEQWEAKYSHQPRNYEDRNDHYTR